MSVYHENALEAGSSLMEYTIESVLGHGGFGITYLASDTTLGSSVAIKEYLPQEIATRDKKSSTVIPHASRDAIKQYHWGLKNFVKEARALARFKHANIVRVLRFLEANSTAYMVMEYEKGQTLFQHLKNMQQPLDEPTLFRVIMPILNGLHAVHEAGLLHLDIKPENIYLRRDGNPMLIDFGSARQAMSETGQATRITLTHGYAPIEQYPDKGALGPWSDVYAIGATMYRCVSGKRPQDSIERYRAILDYKTDPLRPAVQAGAKHYRAGLLECVDWAMQLYAKDRPQTARELQNSLMNGGNRKRATSGPAVVKQNAPSIAPTRRAPRRTRAKSQWTTLLVVVLLGVIGWAAWPTFVETWDALPTTTVPTTTIIDNPSSERAFIATEKPAPRPKEVATEPTAVIRGTPSTLRQVLSGHTDWVQAMTFAPNEPVLATAGNDRTIRLWNAASGVALATFKQRYIANALAYSPDGRRLAAAGLDGSVNVWDVRASSAAGALEPFTTYPLFGLAYAADGRFIAAAGKDRAVYVWDASGKRRYTLEGHTAEVSALASIPNSNELVSAGADRTIRIWNLQTGTEINALTGHKDPVLALAVSSDGRWLASGDAGHTIRIWDLRSRAPARTLTDVPGAVMALAFGPNGNWLAAGSANNMLYVFDVKNGYALQTLSGHQGYVQALAASADGATLASAGRDQQIRLWQPSN